VGENSVRAQMLTETLFFVLTCSFLLKHPLANVR
jgi:hypothetical protein